MQDRVLYLSISRLMVVNSLLCCNNLSTFSKNGSRFCPESGFIILSRQILCIKHDGSAATWSVFKYGRSASFSSQFSFYPSLPSEGNALYSNYGYRLTIIWIIRTSLNEAMPTENTVIELL